MSTSPVQIVNRALAHLATSPINDFSDQTKKAELASNTYGIVRNRILEDADWTFATKRATLPRSAEELPWGVGAQYHIPADMIRVVELKWDIDSDLPPKWRREGDFLITEDEYEQIYIKYIFEIDDSSKFSPYFIEALALALATEWCVALTGDKEHKVRLAEMTQDMLDEAAMKDGSQGSREEYWSRKTQVVR